MKRDKRRVVKDYVKRLSIQKALKIAKDQSNAIVIGSDEVADLDGMILESRKLKLIKTIKNVIQ